MGAIAFSQPNPLSSPHDLTNRAQSAIMTSLPNCPKCRSEYTYEDGNMFVCPECAHEWSKEAVAETSGDARVIKDAHGNLLQDGETVTADKESNVKGSSLVVKGGTT